MPYGMPTTSKKAPLRERGRNKRVEGKLVGVCKEELFFGLVIFVLCHSGEQCARPADTHVFYLLSLHVDNGFKHGVNRCDHFAV